MNSKFPLSNLRYINSDSKTLQKYLQHAMEQNLNPKFEVRSISTLSKSKRKAKGAQEVEFAIVDYFISQIGMPDLKKNNPHLYKRCMIKKMLMQSDILNQQGNDKISMVFLEKAYGMAESLELFGDYARAIHQLEKFKRLIWNKKEIESLHQLKRTLSKKQYIIESANKKIDWIESRIDEIKDKKYIRLYLDSILQHLEKKKDFMDSYRYHFLNLLISSYLSYACHERSLAFEKLKNAQKIVRSKQDFFSDDEQFRTLLMRIRCMIQNENVHHLDRFILKMLFSQRLSFHLKGRLIRMLTDYLMEHQEPLLAYTVLRQINILKEQSEMFESPMFRILQAQLLYKCQHFQLCLAILRELPLNELSQSATEKSLKLAQQCMLQIKLSEQRASTVLGNMDFAMAIKRKELPTQFGQGNNQFLSNSK